MALLQLYSAQEDRHRAVLLAEFLNSLGTRCELITAESAPAGDTVLVAWTAAASRKPWLLDLFARSPDTVALVIDPVPLPVRCERAVDLSTWPARSADTQVAGLVRWLESGDRSSDFGRAAKRKLQRSHGKKSAAAGRRPSVDRTGLGALGVLLLVVALVVGVAMREDGPEPVAQPQPRRVVDQPGIDGAGT
ncbi:MAG: hypothetical protein KDI31_08400, partial [Pseudomonadales bacterium]|nr:hypothetical protein [Pseudomonadales bacterium]